MKMAFKSGKWIVTFGEVVLVCDIDQNDDRFVVSFNANGKKISLHTRNLDKTFRVLEGIYARNSNIRHY